MTVGGLLRLLFSIDGRIDRLTYITVMLGLIVADALAIVGIVYYANSYGTETEAANRVFFFGTRAADAVAFWILLAGQVKRLHDRDKTGWWVCLILVPVLGFLWHFYECCFLPGTPGPNRFDGAEGLTVKRAEPW